MKIKKLLSTFEARIVSQIEEQFSVAMQTCKRLAETLVVTSSHISGILAQQQSLEQMTALPDYV